MNILKNTEQTLFFTNFKTTNYKFLLNASDFILRTTASIQCLFLQYFDLNRRC